MAALTLLHVRCFVYWLGSDLGTFYSAGLVVRRDLSPEARVTAARIMAATDLAARVALVVGLLFVALLASPRPRLRSIGACGPG